MENINISEITQKEIEMSFDIIKKKYIELGGTNKVSKGNELIEWQTSRYN